jgi:hypothetical protein
MRDILFPEAFEPALAKASLTMFFLHTTADKLLDIEDLAIRSKTYERFACM